jgi:glycosyltransferase involved in cell wall biosynthesis
VSLAVVTPTYWPEVRRGAERLAHDLAAALDGAVVTTHRAATERVVEDGVPVTRLWRPPDGRLTRRLYEDHLPTIPLLALELRRRDDEAVIALQATSAVASLRAGRPTVFSHMGIPHRRALANRRARLALTLEACRGSFAVTALSDHARDAFHRWLGIEAVTIPPPVDTATFTPGGERHEHPAIVCAADATEPRKRVGLLREAFAIVRRSEPRAELWLDARTASDGIPMDDLPDVYRRAWVSVLPSWGEAFGLVLAEALACGTPVVGSDLHGIPEVLGGDDRIGRLFDGDDPRALARALLEAIELARDPATAAACRARAVTFSPDRIAARWRDVLPRG